MHGVTAARRRGDIKHGRIAAWKADLLVTFVLEQLGGAAVTGTHP